MKTVKETLLQRVSVRRYQRRPIEPDKIDFIYDAIRNTPTSYNGQQFSVIAVTDQAVKEQLYTLTDQKQIKTCALFLVFCIDYYKLSVFADTAKIDFPRFQEAINGYTVGVIDASLAMQNALIAAESMNLGCCCIGYTRTAHPEQIARLLDLPKGVCVVCGLSIGYPNEVPDLKPKQPRSLLIHENRYNKEHITEELLKYDENVSLYNRTRMGEKTTNDWGGHIIDYYRLSEKEDLDSYLKSQGFDLKK